MKVSIDSVVVIASVRITLTVKVVECREMRPPGGVKRIIH